MKGPASSSHFVTVTASNLHAPRVSKACNIPSARTSSTSLPTSVSKMILAGADGGDLSSANKRGAPASVAATKQIDSLRHIDSVHFHKHETKPCKHCSLP